MKIIYFQTRSVVKDYLQQFRINFNQTYATIVKQIVF